ncbi:MAG TPA: MFS transporter [Gemmatimonadales bacterium]|nr:MFS transporter [Gemmatimonadales bacterium]
MPSLRARVGLDRPELMAWAMYDWANSAFLTVVVTAVFPIYYRSVAAQGLDATAATGRFGLATTVALVIAALIAPPLGVLADRTGGMLRLLKRFLVLGVTATAALALVGEGDWLLALALFVLANIGVSGSFVFYDALLPHIAREEELDRVSSAGYAMGYVGGGLLLALALALILGGPRLGLSGTLPTRISFVLVAIWWAGFARPLFRHVTPPPPSGAPAPLGNVVGDAFTQVARTLRDLRTYPQAFLMLLAFLLYNDGIQTIIRMATIYGEELRLDRTLMIAAIVLVQFVGIPCAFLFGALAGRIGTKPAIFLGIGGYVLITFLGWRLQTSRDFLVLAALVGVVQGGTQALSRSLFARLIPRAKSGEFFGFFAIFEKFAGIFGPLLFSVAVYATQSSRAAILSTLVFFVAGALLLSRVDVAAGEAQARRAEP